MSVIPDREESNFLYACVCFLLSCVAVESWALNCVMVHDSTQIYVGFVG